MKLHHLTADPIAMAMYHSCVSGAVGRITNLEVIDYLMQRAMDSHPKFVGNHHLHTSQFMAEMQIINGPHEGLFKTLRPAFDAYLNSNDDNLSMMIVTNSFDDELLILVNGILFPSRKNIVPIEFVNQQISNGDTVKFAVDIYQNVTNADLIRILGQQAASSV